MRKHKTDYFPRQIAFSSRNFQQNILTNSNNFDKLLFEANGYLYLGILQKGQYQTLNKELFTLYLCSFEVHWCHSCPKANRFLMFNSKLIHFLPKRSSISFLSKLDKGGQVIFFLWSNKSTKIFVYKIWTEMQWNCIHL